MTVTGRSIVFRSTKIDGGFEKETIENGVSPPKNGVFSFGFPPWILRWIYHRCFHGWFNQPAIRLMIWGFEKLYVPGTIGETHVLRWISWIAGWSSPKAVRFHHLNLIFDKQNIKWRAMKHPWTPTKDIVRVLILLTNSLTAPPSAVNMDSSNIDNMTPLQKHQDNQEAFIYFHPKEPRYTSLKHPFCRQGTPVRPHFFEAHEHLQGHWAALKLNPPCVGRQGMWTGVESAVCSGAMIAIMWYHVRVLGI